VVDVVADLPDAYDPDAADYAGRPAAAARCAPITRHRSPTVWQRSPSSRLARTPFGRQRELTHRHSRRSINLLLLGVLTPSDGGTAYGGRNRVDQGPGSADPVGTHRSRGHRPDADEQEYRRLENALQLATPMSAQVRPQIRPSRSPNYVEPGPSQHFTRVPTSWQREAIWLRSHKCPAAPSVTHQSEGT
jgi:hypothetical protein